MKHYIIIFTITISFLLIINDVSISQEVKDTINNSNDIVTSFENVVDKITEFYSTNPIFLDEQPFYSSPTNKIFHLYKHQSPVKLSYDIKKTESLVTPYLGYIEIIVSDVWINTQLEIDSKGKATKGHFNLEECLKDTIFHKYKSKGVLPIKYYYSLQKDEWVFKNIEAFKNNIYDDDWGRDENKHWINAAINATIK